MTIRFSVLRRPEGDRRRASFICLEKPRDRMCIPSPISSPWRGNAENLSGITLTGSRYAILSDSNRSKLFLKAWKG
jgi:hypothetical protein